MLAEAGGCRIGDEQPHDLTEPNKTLATLIPGAVTSWTPGGMTSRTGAPPAPRSSPGSPNRTAEAPACQPGPPALTRPGTGGSDAAAVSGRRYARRSRADARDDGRGLRTPGRSTPQGSPAARGRGAETGTVDV